MRKFTERERDRIEAAIRQAGEELFARHGIRKTTIADLVEPADVAPSTFYQFYDSKEALYLEILHDERAAIAESVIADSFGATDDPEQAIRWFLYRVTEELETNPLLRRVVVEGELDRLRAAVPDAAAEQEAELSFVVPHIEEWVAAGQLRGPDAATVAGALRAATFITLHQEDIGESYPAVRDLLLESVAAGLVEP